MTSGQPERVVFDCNIYFQALISPGGPSGRCLDLALSGRVALFCSHVVVDELRGTAEDERLRRRFKYTPEQLSLLLENIERVATFVQNVPEVFTYARDPSDAHYINLALATGSKYVVSRDNDLLHLADQRRAEARDFHQRFPHLEIVEPTRLLAIVGA